MCIDEGLLQRNVEFHGPLCPGLAIGMQAAAIALRETGPHSQDEEAVAVVETDMCGVDAILVITGCTFGKGNLIHSDWGKNAYTFFRRFKRQGNPHRGSPRGLGSRSRAPSADGQDQLR